MAEESQKPTEEVAAAVTLPDSEPEKEPHPADNPIEPEPAKEGAGGEKADEKEEEKEEEEEEEKPLEEGKTTQITQSVSFKEETNVVGDLPEIQKKALHDLKLLIQDALNKHQLSAPPPPPTPTAPSKEEEQDKKEEVAAATATEEEKKEKEEEVAATTEEKKEVEAEAVETEEKKEVEAVVTEEKKEEPKIEEKPQEQPGAPKDKEKESEAEAEEKKEETVEVVAAEVVEKVVALATGAVDEDGAKTVEAIEESVVSSVAVDEAPSTSTKDKEPEPEPEPEPALPPEEIEIWGIPLLADERSDVILLKFLRARDFKVKDAFTMIRNTVRWRKDFGIDALLEQDLGSDWDKVVFSHGYDKEGHPVCYNVFGEFEDKELYQKTFSDEEKRQKFIRWRIQFLEKSVRKLDFSPTGISTIVQVNDLKNSPGLSKRELRQATNQALQLLQDNYPEFVAKQVFINVPWWYLAFSRMISAFLTQRTKSKFVFAGPSKSADTLFKYIAPEQVPVQYGGLSRESEQEFTTADPVTEVTIKPTTKHTVDFPFSEKGHLVWELRVVGWDVNYGAEFVPSAEDGYTVIVQKSRKIAPTDETVISNSFKIGEPGKVVLTIDNQTSKKKKLLYRSKTKPISSD